jgi:HD-like signal output (HDOD) protein
MHEKISVEKLTPGMVLAGDVRRPDGALVAARGTVLSTGHIALFAAHKAAEVLVEVPEGQEQAREPSLDPLVLEAARDHVRARFVFAGPRRSALAELARLAVPGVARAMVRKKTAFPDPPPPAPVLPAAADETPLPQPDIRDIIASDPALVSLPDVFARICEVLNNPVSTAKDAAQVIGMDQSLAAKLLRLVNSAFYGFPTKVDTLARAVTIVGSRQLTTLALGISVVSLFRDLPPGLADVKSVWKHSVACGLAASALAGLVAACLPDGAERLFVAGLLHDVGRLVMYRNLPELSGRALRQARIEKALVRPAEIRFFGFDHAALGQALLTQWRFPESLALAVGCHHGPGRRGWTPDTAIVHVADVMVNALRLGSSGEYYVPPLSHEAFAILGMAPQTLAEAARKAEGQLDAVLSVFLPDDDPA